MLLLTSSAEFVKSWHFGGETQAVEVPSDEFPSFPPSVQDIFACPIVGVIWSIIHMAQFMNLRLRST